MKYWYHCKFTSFNAVPLNPILIFITVKQSSHKDIKKTKKYQNTGHAL